MSKKVITGNTLLWESSVKCLYRKRF